MTVTRDIGGFGTGANGDGQAYTEAIRQSLLGLWSLDGGLAVAVTGTNALVATPLVADGLTALGDGMDIRFVPASTSTGAMTLDFGGTGAKALVGPGGAALASGAVVAGVLTRATFLASPDHWRLQTIASSTSVTVQGGIHLHRSPITRLVAPIAETTAETQLLTRSHQTGFATSRVVLEGQVSRKHGAGADDADGLTLTLHVDGVAEQTITDGVYSNQAQATAFAFDYSPGDTAAHSYTIRATSTVAAAYLASSTFMVLSEYSPNA